MIWVIEENLEWFSEENDLTSIINSSLPFDLLYIYMYHFSKNE